MCAADQSKVFLPITAKHIFYLKYAPFHSEQEWTERPAWREPPEGDPVWRDCLREAARCQAALGGLYRCEAGALRSTLCAGDVRPPHSTCAACALLITEMAPSNGSIARRIGRRKRAMESNGHGYGKTTNSAFLNRNDLLQRVGDKEARRPQASIRQRRLQATASEANQRADSAMLHCAAIARAAFSSDATATAALAQVEHEAAQRVEKERELVEAQLQRERELVEAQLQRESELVEAQLQRELAASTQLAQVAASESQGTHHSATQALELQSQQHSALISSCELAYQGQLRLVQQSIESQIQQAKAEQISQMPDILQCLYRADQVGRLEQYPEAAELIAGMAQCLEKGATHGRVLNATEQHFYGMLLNSGNPWVEQFVAKNLFGPSLRWAKQHRASLPTIPMGDVCAANVTLLHNMLCRYGLEAVPGVVSEDGSTCTRRVDWAELLGNTEAEVWANGITLYGFSGDPLTVHSLEELEEVFRGRERSLANYVYVYTWVPILPHAPHVPFCIVATDNCFEGKWVWEQWRVMHQLFAARALKCIGHVSDGDSRLRLCDFWLLLYCNRKADWCTSSARIDHWLLRTGCTYCGVGAVSFSTQGRSGTSAPA
jgi:hypothetical protein